MHPPLLQHDPSVGVLVMDETGSVGLDLSFVGWVFLMEPLADGSLEAQVTARAHRMGACQAVHVETLVMKVHPTPVFPAVLKCTQPLFRDWSSYFLWCVHIGCRSAFHCVHVALSQA